MKVDFSKKTVGGFNYELTRGISLAATGAAEFGECMETMERIQDNNFESWTREWGKTADFVAGYARSQMQGGCRSGARAAYLRASNYYRMACFYAAHTDPRHRDFWSKSRDCFHRMIESADQPVERLQIRYGKALLPGYFIPSGQENRPTLIAIGGFDSTAEEVYCWIGAAARDYAWNCLIFEGPGQWGALMDNPGLVFCPDYEKPVGAAVDYLMTRSDTDTEKIAIIGYSMGGYLSMRGALDPRIRAAIPNTLVVDCGAAAREGMKGLVGHEVFMDAMFKLIMKKNTPARWGFQHSSWVLGISSAHEWVAAYEKFTLLGFEHLLRGKPILFLFSEDDIMDAAAPGKTIVTGILDYIGSLDCPRFVRLFTKQEGASSHCQMGGLSYAQAAIFGWLEHALCGKALPAQSSVEEAELFIALFGKYGGASGAAKAKALAPSLKFV
ncbi:MAG: dienelactone hydrolase family protein [Spirochaetota bacterium]|jgi:pimeloyl-ACP methyl ester carboxylesterase|nr:dienelactone hydrolase family protein [Spirochaetota bacterium]